MRIFSSAENFRRVAFLICFTTSFDSAIFSTPFRGQRTLTMELKSAISSVFLHAGKHLNASTNQRRQSVPLLLTANIIPKRSGAACVNSNNLRISSGVRALRSLCRSVRTFSPLGCCRLDVAEDSRLPMMRARNIWLSPQNVTMVSPCIIPRQNRFEKKEKIGHVLIMMV